MPGFESCCLATKSEVRIRLFSIVTLAGLALVASHFTDITPTIAVPAPVARQAPELFNEVGPHGEAPQPEAEVLREERSLLSGFEARP